MTALLFIYGAVSAFILLAVLLHPAWGDINLERTLALIFFWPLIALGVAARGAWRMVRGSS